jgi:hypothetical protein
MRLGTDPATGLVNHQGSFESCGAPEAVKAAEGQWHHWVVTFDGWMERIYRDGQLLKEHNNFIMLRPEGSVVIGADGQGANNFRGYLSSLAILPQSVTADEVRTMYNQRKDDRTPSLGDDDFDESDPDSRFTLSPTMKKVFSQDEARLSAQTGDFNNDPLHNGATILKEVEGDFVIMARLADMEGLATHSVKGYNEAGIIIQNDADSNISLLPSGGAGGGFFQLGVFPLYNCGNMLTILSPHGRPQFPNSKGYDFDPILQFERRGNLLFARTSREGQKLQNMPGSPIELTAATVGVGVYQTTYSNNHSWAELTDFIIYQ